jgi:hypothetical protein
MLVVFISLRPLVLPLFAILLANSILQNPNPQASQNEIDIPQSWPKALSVGNLTIAGDLTTILRQFVASKNLPTNPSNKKARRCHGINGLIIE